MKRGLKWVFYGLLAAMLAVVLGTLLPRPLLPAAASAAGAGSARILVLSGPIHTDIAVPLTEETRARFRFVEAAGVPIAHPQAQWLIFGWGGRSFYLETPTWSELKAVPVLKALTLDRSVMHVDIAGRIIEPQASVASFDLDAAGFERLLAFISDSFTRDAGAVVSIDGFSYNGNDRFFEAAGSFNALFGCNTWTARALRQAGLRTGLWNPVPPSLGLSLRIHN
ncbi:MULTISPECIES: TIGR02117 family protein [unclassified Ensifer]|uniref:TIGR02117 family protein n=1 Tax=unclassified Ensifer TaxID=2633371 RepID=UPI0008131B6A|nr:MULTISPECIES: TIGR02117 family protein [unclassified Ensifer]OCP02393.1 urease-associated protein [Ensifer sp. LC14]OCP14121.1 urease-associated protein [Ensifer sp. LC13]OCP14798.1 urease-associated protein [Ensifer sp. LC11]OCP34284.1 urease-associated protein [Ensifer sp. LC499]